MSVWEHYSSYRSSNIARVNQSTKLKWADHVVTMEEGRSAFKMLTGKSTRKRPLGSFMRGQYQDES